MVHPAAARRPELSTPSSPKRAHVVQVWVGDGSEGAGVGTLEGAGVGMREGCIDGAGVGIVEGAGVGSFDGAGEGMLEGCIDGAGEGTLDVNVHISTE